MNFDSQSGNRFRRLESAIIQVGVISHDLGHIEQALTNVIDGLQAGSMTEERAFELLKLTESRLDVYAKELLDATTKT
jgi:ABC-type dipeptide/oligopeptide/nickel transport system ATPase component